MAARASTTTNFGRRPARPLQLSSLLPPLVTTVVLLLFCCCSSVQSASLDGRKCAKGINLDGKGKEIGPYVINENGFRGFAFKEGSQSVNFEAITGKDMEFNVVVNKQEDKTKLENCKSAALDQIKFSTKCDKAKETAKKNWKDCANECSNGVVTGMKCDKGYTKADQFEGKYYITEGNIRVMQGFNVALGQCGLRMLYTEKEYCVLVAGGTDTESPSVGGAKGFFCCLRDNGVFIAVMVLPTVFLLLLIVLIIWMVVYQRSQLKAIEAWIEECMGGGMTGMSKLGGATKSKLLTMKGGATTKKSMMTQKGGSKSKFGTTTKGGKSKLGQTTVGGASKAASTKRRSVSVPNTQSRGSRENLRK